ncbi:tetratricopeptide repeat-containing hybrid sensor histidine kinase/response regulator [Flavobacterium pallidum]|uniref:tetratricopeptide repeat-containing hybrid sensor histidine kinase/response regulator n=1 Tax=Flavobacterium pallidum TaxID=2172098 RepID=UPI0011B29F10|nr:response regulator [Flavobacterium pallidum]
MKKIFLIISLLFVQAIMAQSEAKEKEAVEKIINNAAHAFRTGEYEKSLDLSSKALVRAFKLDDDFLIAHSYNAIAAVYYEFSESKRAIEFYTKALHYAESLDNNPLKDFINSNLGNVYYYSKIDVGKGIEFYKKSLYYAVKSNDSSQIAYAKLNITSAYFYLGQFKKGIVYLYETKNFIERKGQPESKLSYNGLLGLYNTHETKNTKAAELYYRKAIAIGESNNLNTFTASVYDNYVDHLVKYKRFREADSVRRIYKKLHSKLYSEAMPGDLDDTAIQIELDEYKNQLEKIESTNERQQKKIRDSRTISILFGILLLFLLIMVYMLYKTNVFRKKLNAELTKANEELQAAKEVAEQNSQLKTQFISTVSHELRTPLYGVIGITDMIIDEHKELVNNEQLNSLKFSANYLLDLVNDILQMNKMEDKRTVLEKTDFSLHDELLTIRNSLQFLADNNGNAFNTIIDPEIPKRVNGDELRLSQILVNLASNALKFTRNGEVTITAKLNKFMNNKYFIDFTVQDNGIGIAEADQEKIFDKFVQIERKEGDYQGTGLGLAIVKRLIDLFDSSISIDSAENTGTTFAFTIAFEKAQYDNDISTPDVMEMVGKELDILVVEDNKINQMVTKKIIERHGHRCRLAASGNEAIEAAQKESFDIILMDINMPGMNGYDTTKSMRELGIYTPVIALTAYDKKEVTEQAANAGINDVIVKPFEPSLLFEMMYRQLQVK